MYLILDYQKSLLLNLLIRRTPQKDYLALMNPVRIWGLAIFHMVIEGALSKGSTDIFHARLFLHLRTGSIQPRIRVLKKNND